jgi:plasmid stabilization system protein ParE
MLKLRINPLVAADLKEIRDYIAEDNVEYAAKTMEEIYGRLSSNKSVPGYYENF